MCVYIYIYIKDPFGLALCRYATFVPPKAPL